MTAWTKTPPTSVLAAWISLHVAAWALFWTWVGWLGHYRM